jgi:hypothetical protein
MPDDVTNELVTFELNTDYSTRGLSANEIVAVVQAWQNGALSRDSMLGIFRRGEVLPEGPTNEEATKLIHQEEVKRIRAVSTSSEAGSQMQRPDGWGG